MDDVRLYHGDCLDVLRSLGAASVDAVVTDPPAGIGFMGKTWDSFGGRCNGNAEADRDGGKGKGPVNARNPHGKDTQPFGYSGSAMPKKGEREAFIAFLSAVMAECLRVAKPGAVALVWAIPRTSHWTATACEDAGWRIEDRISHLFGQGFPKHKSKLKPACEDWWLCRKPGPLWLGVEEGRIGTNGEVLSGGTGTVGKHEGWDRPWMHDGSKREGYKSIAGRWPANVALSCDCPDDAHGPECPVRLLDEQSGECGGATRKQGGKKFVGRTFASDSYSLAMESGAAGYGDTGGASRFYYVAKASKADRGEGNTHPTVKSTALMRWLVKLACRVGGRVLDPFMGSGTTGKACVQTGRRFVGCELDRGYFEIAERRIAEEQAKRPLFAGAAAGGRDA